jgi:sec-independent protein translocase protein TatB
MFDSGHILVILVVALVLIGPKHLPDLMKALGKGMAEFRRMTSDVKSTLEREIEKVEELKRIEETKKELFGDDSDKPAEAESSSAEAVKAEEAPAQAEASENPGETQTATVEAPAANTTEAAKAQADAKPATSTQDNSHA